jgi:eukaryotic-like serine/threonine-protein kinase
MSNSDSIRCPPATGPGGDQATASYAPDADADLPGVVDATPAAPPRNDQTVISNRPPLAAPLATPMPQPSELRTVLIGERLGQFELQEYIGGGGMGAVFRALDTDLNRIVALKVLARDQSHDDETVRRFRNEAQSAARLDHENIARVYFVGEDRGLHFIAFEHIEGVNIRALVERKGPLPVAEAIGYVLQVAEALSHANGRDVVHRDIKPSNILITANGRAKLVDMGLARVRRVDQSGDDLTASGVTLGTFDYISPEQARDPRNADVRSDIYSLGCTLYYMLTGRPPFPDGTVLQKLLQHQGDAPPDPSQFNPGLPDELCRIVRKMLAKDPRRRYQRPSELLADLLVLADDLGWQPQGAGSFVWLAPRSKGMTLLEQQVPWMAPVAALILIAVALHFLWSPGPQELPALNGFGPSLAAAPRATVANERERASAGRSPSGSAPSSSRAQVSGAQAHAASSGTAPTDAGAGNIAPPAGNEVDDPNLEEATSSAPSSNGAAGDPGSAAADASPDDVPRDDTIDGGDDPAASAPEGAQAQAPANLDSDARERVVPGNETSPPTSVTENNIRGNVDGATAPDDGAAAEPSSGTLSTTVRNRPNVLVVDPTGSEAGEFRTLKAACQVAKSGDVIELRFNGRREETRPIRLENVRVTIRAAESFRPVVVFRPNEVDPLAYPRSMLTVAGGILTLINVSLELEIPRPIPSDRWALIEAQRAELLRLERCTLTIRNASESQLAYHQGVSFLEVTAPPGEGMMMDDATAPLPPPAPPVNIQLQNSIARGEAVFLRSPGQQSISLLWENGLLATTEQLYSASAGTVPVRQSNSVRVDLRHVTAVARGGLCLLSSTDQARTQAMADFRISNSIILCDASAALVQQLGVFGGDFRKGIVWYGNRNFYEGFTTFWRTLPLNPQDMSEEWPLARWQTFWSMNESAPSWRKVLWKKLPDATRPMHAQTPADYALDMTSMSNPARNAGDDGRDVGLEPELLPPVPPPPSAPESPATSAAATGT